MTTEEIKHELGNWGEEYLAHRIGNQQWDNDLLFGEREGIVQWLTSRKVISRKKGEYKNVIFNYDFIVNLREWKNFERKLELWRELETRRYRATLGEDEYRKSIQTKICTMRKQLNFIKNNS